MALGALALQANSTFGGSLSSGTKSMPAAAH
jgi:hypothetical protein